MTINRKLIPVVVCLTVLPLLLFGYYCTDRAVSLIEAHVAKDVRSQAEGIVSALVSDPDFMGRELDLERRETLQDFVADYNRMFHRDIVILDRTRVVLADAEPQNVGSVFPHFSHDAEKISRLLEGVFKDGRPATFVENSSDGVFRLMAMPIRHEGEEIQGILLLEYSDLFESAQDLEGVFKQTLLLGNLAIAALAGLLAAFLTHKISRPVKQLARTATAFGAGDLSRRAEVSSGDEIGSLAIAFNRMADNLSSLLFQERQASEQLRREIVERQGVERALRESEELYRSLVENIGLGVVLINRDYEIMMANSTQARSLGTTPEALVGRRCYQEFESRGMVCDHCPGRQAMAGMRVVETDIEVVQPDGNKRVMRLRAFPLRGVDGEVAGFIEVTEDITERRRIKDELHRTRHLELIGTLAGGIAHDFNNMLAGIMGNITLARLFIKNPEKALDKLQICEKAVNRAKDLSQQLLTFSKGGAPVKEATDLAGVLRESVSFVMSGSAVSSSFDLPAGLWPVDADSGQISQVFQNLVTNGIQAMPGGGELEIVARNREIGPGNPSLPAGRYVEVVVRDHGTGIPREQLDRIFVPFFTTKEKGSGLGLAISHSIIRKHLGRIDVESTMGVGTTFRVVLPASEAPVVASPAGGSAPTGQGRILVMDDEEVVRESAAELLGCLGYRVEMAADGLEALDHYRKAAGAGQGYDAVILDLTVPGGMGGRETLERLTELDPRVRAIVSSGYANDAVLADYRSHGFAGLISKPYSLEELGRVVAEVLKGAA